MQFLFIFLALNIFTNMSYSQDAAEETGTISNKIHHFLDFYTIRVQTTPIIKDDQITDLDINAELIPVRGQFSEIEISLKTPSVIKINLRELEVPGTISIKFPDENTAKQFKEKVETSSESLSFVTLQQTRFQLIKDDKGSVLAFTDLTSDRIAVFTGSTGYTKSLSPSVWSDRQTEQSLKEKSKTTMADDPKNPGKQISEFDSYKRDLQEKFDARIAEEKAKEEAAKKEAEALHEAEKVLTHLTDANLDAKIAENKPLIVKFTASWCGPCKRFTPVLAEIQKKLGDKIVIADIDTDKHSKKAAEYGVQGIPHLVFFKDGQKVFETSGYKDEKTMIKFIEEKLGIKL